MVTQTLRELEADGLIIRKMYYEVPLKVEYSLSATGKPIIPFLVHLNDWSQSQMAKEEEM